MQIAQLLLGFGIACTAALDAQAPEAKPGGRPDHIISEKHRFSVVFPIGWFVFRRGDLPIFSNFPAEKSLPQGQLPPGGASIALQICQEVQERHQTSLVSSCAQREIAAQNGTAIERKETAGPLALGQSPALQLVFEQRGLGRVGKALVPSLHFVTVLWRYGDRVVEAELSYVTGDPEANKYEQTLSQLVRSFRPI